MKRVFFVTLAAVMMLAACKKDVEKPQPKAFDPFDDRAVEARIKEFNQKLQQKSGEPMSIEDAVWCIEAALNYNYGNVSLPQESLLIDSLIFTINYNQVICFDFISQMYSNSLNLIEEYIKKGYNLIVCDVSYVKINFNLKIKAKFVFSKITHQKYVTYPNLFGPTDYWMYGDLLGNCYNQQYQGTSDAAEQIQYWISSGFCAYPKGTYFTDIETLWIHAHTLTPQMNIIYINPNDDIPNDNLYDSRIFLNRTWYNGQWLSNFDPCLTPEEMNFYAQNTAWVLNTPINNGGAKPANKHLISIDMFGFVYLPYGCGSQIKAISHGIIAQYGIKHEANSN